MPREIPTADELDDRYNPEGDGEHPRFMRQHWRNAVLNQETLQGYWEWLRSQLQMEAVENSEDRETQLQAEVVFAALNNCEENGFPVDAANEVIAADLCRLYASIGQAAPESLIPHIIQWKATKRV